MGWIRADRYGVAIFVDRLESDRWVWQIWSLSRSQLLAQGAEDYARYSVARRGADRFLAANPELHQHVINLN